MSLSSLTSNRGSNHIGNNANTQVRIQELTDMILPSLAFSLTTPSKTYASASKLRAVPPNTPSFCLYPEHHVPSSTEKLIPIYASGSALVISSGKHSLIPPGGVPL